MRGDRPEAAATRQLSAPARKNYEQMLVARNAELVHGVDDDKVSELTDALAEVRAIQTVDNAYRLQVPLLRALLTTTAYGPESAAGAELLGQLCQLHDRYGAVGPAVDRELDLGQRVLRDA
jgi:hypothetical protein